MMTMPMRRPSTVVVVIGKAHNMFSFICLSLLLILSSHSDLSRIGTPCCCSAYRFADHIVIADKDREGGKVGDDDDDDDGTVAGRSFMGGQQQMTLLADIPPPTVECSITTWDRTDQILEQFWSDNDGYFPITTVWENNQTDDDDNDDNDDKYDDDDNDHPTRQVKSQGLQQQQQYRHGRHELTYGEVTPLGVRQLAYEMGIATGCRRKGLVDVVDDDGTEGNDSDIDYAGGTIDSTTNKHNDDSNKNNNKIVFYDLGSGVGRLVTQIVLDDDNDDNGHYYRSPRIERAVGVELSPERHLIGQRAITNIRNSGSSSSGCYKTMHDDDGNSGHYCNNPSILGRHDGIDSATSHHQSLHRVVDRIELVHGNVLDVDLRDVTHIYMSSLCFPDDVLEAIQVRIRDEAPNVQVVAALNRLHVLESSSSSSSSLSSAESWGEAREVPIQMSWGPGLAKVYHRRTTVAVT